MSSEFNEKYEWIRLSEEDSKKVNALTDQQLLRIEVADKKICVSRVANKLYGINDRCPHAGTPFTHNGSCNKKGVIVCATHHYKFHIQTGMSADGNQYKIPTYAFEVQGDIVFVGIKK